MGYYLYCILPAGLGPSVPVVGIAGEDVLIVETRGLAVWCSELKRPPLPDLAQIRRHDEVIRSAEALGTTPLPIRFGQWIPARAALEERIAKSAEEYREALSRIAGSVEFGIRVRERQEGDRSPRRLPGAAGSLDPGRFPTPTASAPGPGRFPAPTEPRAPTEPATPTEPPAPAEDAVPPHRAPSETEAPPPAEGARGRAYLRELALRREQASATLARGERLAEAFRAAVGEDVRETRVDPPEAGEVARISHLVPRVRVATYREGVERFRDVHPELEIVLSGPWPPYSFVS